MHFFIDVWAQFVYHPFVQKLLKTQWDIVK
jgi:hypothetical protein